MERRTLSGEEGQGMDCAWMLRRNVWFSLLLLLLPVCGSLAGAAFAFSRCDVASMGAAAAMPESLFPLAALLLPFLWRCRGPLAAARREAARDGEYGRMARELEALRKRVEIDPLTGLLNKAALTEKVLQSLRDGDRPCALFMVDMDNFKRVNDTYGHLTGDRVLARTGEILRGAFAGRVALVGRVGGDEFMALLFGIRDVEELEAVRRRLRVCLRIPLPQSETFFTGSVGCALREAGEDFESLYGRTDSLLYEDKRRNSECRQPATAVPPGGRPTSVQGKIRMSLRRRAAASGSSSRQIRGRMGPSRRLS